MFNARNVAIIFIGLLIVSLFSAGCLNSSTPSIESSSSKLARAIALTNSADSRYSYVDNTDFDTIDVATVRANAVATSRELQEAIEILDQLNLDDFSPQTQADLKFIRVRLTNLIAIAEMVEGPEADRIEDLKIILSAKDPAVVDKKTADYKTKTLMWSLTYMMAIERMDTVDPDTLSPDFKKKFLSLKTVFRHNIDFYNSEYLTIASQKK